MTESVKLLEIAKQEPATPPTTPEKSPSNIIKERLNLHVKRRLQQEASPLTAELLQHGTTYNNSGGSNECVNKNNNEGEQIQLNKRSDKQVKTRKPYQKRSEKTATNDAAATVRKYKRTKTKQVGSTSVVNKFDDVSCSAISEITALPTCSSGGNGADDGDGSLDGANEAETKCMPAARDKDKCPDVLGMVLSAKKRALMQHPDVQAFLNQVMEAIKS